MAIRIKSFGRFSGGGDYNNRLFFGGEAIGPAILSGDAVRQTRKTIVIEHGFSDLEIKGRFRLGRDEEGKFVKAGKIRSIEISQPGEGVVQQWTGLNWSIRRVEKVIRRAERGDEDAFLDFFNGFKVSWTLSPRGGDDGWVQGSFNDDRVRGSQGSDQIFTFEGNDRVDGRGGRDDVWAGAGNDRLFGGGGDDLLRGGDGRDRIDGGKGADNVQGGDGADVVRGGDGDDFVRGDWDGDNEDGNDRLFGGRGNDQLSGGPGDDVLFGGDGDDQLQGDENGTRREAAGDDRLFGGAGNDRLEGGKGADELVGGAGDDALFGQAGSDIFDFRGRDLGTDLADFDLERDFRLQNAPLTLTDRLRLDEGGRAEIAFIDDPDPDAVFGAEVLVLLIFAPDGAGGELRTGTVRLQSGLSPSDLPAAQLLIDDAIL